MTDRNALFRFIYVTAFILLVTGCAPIRPDTFSFLDKKALLVSHQARSFNQHIVASKGTGWARIQTNTRMEKFKIAWAAVFPNKIRITFMLSGLPMETIIATGEKITFLSHTGNHVKYSYYSKNPDMEDYIHVPIKLSEMISILLGHLPVKKFDDAWFSPSDPSLSTITLKQNWKGGRQYLYLSDKGKIEGIKRMDNQGKLLYDMTIAEYKAYDSGDIPVHIIIKDKGDRTLTLTISHFMANPPIKDAVFQLTESR